ncbi:phosphotransferase [Pseudomonas sp. ME-P-057]|uniref:phosphotransferase n=1 Tax=Pseudomonas sp. ME-P-057 TaxID=3040321 RepID=UPI0025558D0D|nr:phosphotransferase [Pseudomonas sp. ME-P-057]
MSDVIVGDLSCTELMTTGVPLVDARHAAGIAKSHYGLAGAVQVLNGERDANFLVRTAQGSFVLKVINPAEQPSVTTFQTQALLHIERSGADLPVPRVVADLEGGFESTVRLGEDSYSVRVVTFLEGVPQNLGNPSIALMHDLGSTLAKIDIALRSFEHPGAQRSLLWDVGHAERIRALSQALSPRQYQLVSKLLDRHEREVKPRLVGMRSQVIHNDLNPANVLLDATNRRVAAVIDFGDALQANLINELGTALAYQFDADAADPFWQIKPFVAAYNALIPLAVDELEVLGDLIAVRMAMAITIAQWRAELYPNNRTYVLRNLINTWRNLQRLAELDPAALSLALRTACESEHA